MYSSFAVRNQSLRSVFVCIQFFIYCARLSNFVQNSERINYRVYEKMISCFSVSFLLVSIHDIETEEEACVYQSWLVGDGAAEASRLNARLDYKRGQY